MTTSRIKQYSGFAVVIIISILANYFISANHDKKIAVVDAVKLFNGFTMKKELEKEAEVKLKYFSLQVDSLDGQIKLAGYGKDSAVRRSLIQKYLITKRELENQYNQSNQLINEMVWKRLNPLIDEYGKKNGFHLIIGANGMGSVLYNDNYFDKTEEVIQYVNKNYEN
ncbi:MAG: OmpH family outer membrane protein [Bacteroidetes bacterium]|nr:OmpH family outer membrane protein [Bacteroidota bacterium]